MSHKERVVVLVDMDCFYCQVEEKLDPALKGKPLAVVQYNAWRGGGIIAVNYPARERGVTRHMRGDEAKKKCPEIELARVPNVRGKADLTKYREAGKTVAKVLQTFTSVLERASVDEAYLDITEAVQQRLDNASKDISLSQLKNTHVVGCDTMDFLYNLYNSGLYMQSNLMLAFGGVIAEEIRAAVFEQTGYTCSAGIAHNKILAKLACGLHKPNKQTILPHDSIQELYENLPVHKIRSLGGKFGNSLSEDLGIKNMAELLRFSEKDLRKRYDEKTASWLYNIARGIDLEPVTTRLVSKSIGCCKKFPGKSALIDTESVTHWLSGLADEIAERLEKDLEENNRKAKQMVVSFSYETNGKDIANSRTHTLSSYDAKKIATDAFDVIKKNCMKPSGTFCLKFLGISAGKFEDCRNVNAITSFFKVQDPNAKQDSNNTSKNTSCSSIASYFIKSSKAEDVNVPEIEDPIDSVETDNKANFSDTTEELTEDSSEFVFLEENTTENEVSDSDSISNELCNGDSNISDQQPQKQSFFLRYLENLRNQQPTSPVSRDFDTSRILDENIDATSDEERSCDNPELDDRGTSPVLNLHDVPSTSHDVFQFQDTTDLCKECNQKVPQSEMTSHMDYHLALKIVREESHLYKNNPKPVSVSKPTKDTTKKSTKRKSCEIDKNMTLETFFKNNQTNEPEGDTEICPQCHKRIDVASFASHLDYHAAKKLHSELNNAKPLQTPDRNCATKTRTKGLKKNKTIGKTKMKENISVRTFFKPVS